MGKVITEFVRTTVCHVLGTNVILHVIHIPTSNCRNLRAHFSKHDLHVLQSWQCLGTMREQLKRFHLQRL